MRLTSKPLGLVIIIILMGGIALTNSLGWWQTSGRKQPTRIETGEAAGEYNPADLRGSYTFGEVSDLFAIPLPVLSAAFGLPSEVDPVSFPLKSLETLYVDAPSEIGVESVRLFVAWYKGLPYPVPVDEETYLPGSAVQILLQGKLSQEQVEYLKAHTLGSPTSQPVDEQPVTTAEAQSHTERKVNAQTTFQQVLDWGVSQAEIEQVLGSAMPDSTMVIKDYVSQQGLAFSEVKTGLQALVDAKQP
jgi:hypothetical protein